MSNVEAPELDQDFLNATEHVPGEVSDDKRHDFADVNTQASDPGPGEIVQGWTVEKVAAVFNGVFTLLVVSKVFIPVGGEHWNIPLEKSRQLGEAWLPIFVEHVPYGNGEESWLPDLIMWTGAIGALKMVCGHAITIEMQNLREYLKATRQQRSTTAGTTQASTATATSQASSSSPASAAAGRPPSNGESFPSPPIAE